jgi:hypothetical protein
MRSTIEARVSQVRARSLRPHPGIERLNEISYSFSATDLPWVNR